MYSFECAVLVAVFARSAPVIAAWSATECPRVVVVHGENELVLCGIFWHVPALVVCLRKVRVVARNEQEAVCIVPAGFAHGVYEGLVDFVCNLIAFIIGKVAAVFCNVLVVQSASNFLVGTF